MQSFFEYAPLVLFFIIYQIAGIYWATFALILGSALHIAYLLITKQKVPAKNWIIFGLIAGFGGLTIFLQDDTFLKWKVTIINLFFAIALVASDLIFKKNIIKQLMSEALELPEKIWTNLNLAWAVFFTVCALLNIYIAFNFSQEVWVNFKVFGLMGLTFTFAIGSVMALYKYLPKDDAAANNSDSDDN